MSTPKMLSVVLLPAILSPAPFEQQVTVTVASPDGGLFDAASQAEMLGTAILPSDVVELLQDLPSVDGRLLGKLCSYLEYERDWDGEGAEPPSIDAIFAAMEFLDKIPPEVGVPKPMALPTGEVALYWEDDERYVEIGFDQTGNFYAYGKHPTLDSIHLDDQAVVEAAGFRNFPAPLREILTTAPAAA